MPVYNGGSYFEMALRSALAQTYADLEIVVVNDGSIDNGETDAICRRYVRLHPGKIIYIQQPNAGVGAALNAGIAAMTGDIFCWLSHDDLFEPHKLEAQVAFFERLGRDDAILICDYRLIGPDDAVIRDIRLDHSAALASPRLPLYGGWINGCTIFAPADLLREPGGPFDPVYRYVQDYRLWLKLVQTHEIFHQPEMLVRYRIHPGQDSHKPAAAAEGDALWIDMIGSCSPAVRAQLAGSSWRFFNQMQHDAYANAADFARRERDACIASTLVSVVLWAGPDTDAALEALASVQRQSHQRLDILLLVRGAAPQPLMAAAASDARIRIIDVGDAPSGANLGLAASLGEYVALLDGEDRFQPQKIERQLEAMQIAGALLCHTSYNLGQVSGFDRIASGRLNGRVAPSELLAGPPAFSTVMIHRLLIAEGLVLSADKEFAADPLPWIEACRRRPLLGLDDPLTLVKPAHCSPDFAWPNQDTRAPFDPAAFLTAAEPDRSFSGVVARLLVQADLLGIPRAGCDVDISSENAVYSHALPAMFESEEVVFGSGVTPWDYVARIPLDPDITAQSSHLQVIVQADEQVYAMIVDAAYNPIGAREPVDPGPVPSILLFEIPANPQPVAVVIQAGPRPRETVLRMVRVRLFSSATESVKPF